LQDFSMLPVECPGYQSVAMAARCYPAYGTALKQLDAA
jgi:hypothetical protein